MLGLASLVIAAGRRRRSWFNSSLFGTD